MQSNSHFTDLLILQKKKVGFREINWENVEIL